MPVVIPVRDSRDRFAIVSASGDVLFWAEYEKAQQLIKDGKVVAIRSKGGKGRIRCLAVAEEHAPGLQKPTALRQHGTMGDSHTQIRECTCKDCRANGSPIDRHLDRSTNPPGVWTIDTLPRWGRNDWKTRALFRRPLLEAMYGKAKVDACLNPEPTQSPSKAA